MYSTVKCWPNSTVQCNIVQCTVLQCISVQFYVFEQNCVFSIHSPAFYVCRRNLRSQKPNKDVQHFSEGQEVGIGQNRQMLDWVILQRNKKKTSIKSQNYL